MKKLLALSVLLSISSMNAQEAPLQGFDDYVNKALQDWQVPGVAIAVVKDDKVILAKGYGVKNIDNNQKIDEKTLFNIASNTKSFTAAALAILVDEGKLRWDDPVVKHLPRFEMFDSYVTEHLTIRDLLTHRNGLEAYSGDIIWWGSDYTREEVVRRVRYIQPSVDFRSTPRYQNIPFIIAGLVIEAATGESQTWEEFVSDRILNPLQMNDSMANNENLSLNNNKATPYLFDIFTDKLIPLNWRNLDNGAPAVGINSNVMDMANWLRFQLNDGEFDNKQLISSQQMNEMHTPQIAIPFSNPSEPKLKSSFRAYGLGWTLREYAGEKIMQDIGLSDGFSSMTAVMPDKNLGVVVLSNIHDSLFYTPFVWRIFDAFLGLEPTDWSAYYLKSTLNNRTRAKQNEEKLQADRLQNTKPTLEFVDYAGIYANDLYGEVVFTVENEKLVVRLAHSPTYIGDLEHWQNDTFRVIWRDPVAGRTFLTFKAENGKITSVSMNMADFIEGKVYKYLKKN